MCGLNGVVSLSGASIAALPAYLEAQARLQAHRGPDDRGTWMDPDRRVGLGLQRLSIFDLSHEARQPMSSPRGSQIVFNGAIYNFPELRRDLYGDHTYRSNSDTEVLLAAYEREGPKCLERLRGMFAFAVWDGEGLFAARDRFGIKPFHYTIVDDLFIFASEAKALMPFVSDIETDPDALAEYLVFQCTLGDQTLFKGVKQLPPGHALEVRDGRVRTWRYWDVHYDVDLEHSPRYFQDRLRHLIDDSVALHLRSDVPVGSYLSGGIDSSLVALLAQRSSPSRSLDGFHGRFIDYPGYDESRHAMHVAESGGIDIRIIDITAEDFRSEISKVIYHLDYPVAGPGAFPQFVVSRLARGYVKVVLGGQGGDEIFGGYARYLLAYFEQCIKAAIEGTHRQGNFVVTAESIIPNLGVLREYMPLIKRFWSEGLFEPLDARYFRLIDRSVDVKDEIQWGDLDLQRVFESFSRIFNSSRNVHKEAYFDSMTHFDFKVLLPALLHVEDRMSMAQGLEARVPFLDHPLVEFAATVPADVKFEHGKMKHLLKETFRDVIPQQVSSRRDKMGFPVPLTEWAQKDLKDFFQDTFRSQAAKSRPFFNADRAAHSLEENLPFGRKLWGLLSLELWQQQFHDRAAYYRRQLTDSHASTSSERTAAS